MIGRRSILGMLAGLPFIGGALAHEVRKADVQHRAERAIQEVLEANGIPDVPVGTIREVFSHFVPDLMPHQIPPEMHFYPSRVETKQVIWDGADWIDLHSPSGRALISELTGRRSVV